MALTESMYITLNSAHLHDHVLSNDTAHPILLSGQTSMKLPSKETVVMSQPPYPCLCVKYTSVLNSLGQ